VSAPIGTSGADFQAVAKKVASVDTLDAFLRDLRTRYPESSAIPPGGTAGNAPAAESAPDKAKGPQTNAAPLGEAAPNGPAIRDAGSSPLPPKAPAGVPVKPDTEPTGSTPRLPRMGARAR
jgi:hypothetical protein